MAGGDYRESQQRCGASEQLRKQRVNACQDEQRLELSNMTIAAGLSTRFGAWLKQGAGA